MFFKRLLCLIVSACMLLLSLTSCIAQTNSNATVDPTPKAKKYYKFFNTESLIISYKGDSEEEFQSNHEAVAELLEEYHRLFDIYYEYSGLNNIKTINKNAGKAPVKVDDRLIDFLLYSKEIYSLTNGKTNIAMGSVLKLWHDCRKKATNPPYVETVPSENELRSASLHCDINNLIIDKEAATVYISDPDMLLDVGATGKGYATERAAEMLIERGVSSYVLNIGGNIRIIGEKVSGDGWVTGITNPDNSSDESFIGRVIISNSSLVTSGDYERYYTVNGVKYHHIIDPVTLVPAKYFTSVSVLTKDSGLADALSTALFCMSYEDGLALTNSIGGVEVIWVDLNYSIKTTPGVELLPNSDK